MITFFKSRKSKSVVSMMIAMFLMLSSFVSFAGNLDTNQSNQELLKDKISSEVFDMFDSGEDKVEVLVKLREQADVEKIANDERLQLNSLKLDNDEMKLLTREAVIHELESTVERTQYRLLQYIETETKNGNIEEYESYYIVNMIYIKATQDVVNKIALMNDVEKVYFNEKIYLNDYTRDPEGIIEIVEEETDIAEEVEVEEGKLEVIEEEMQETMRASDITPKAVLPSDIEWNIKIVNADKVWSTYGIDGTGVVIGMIDSGVTWNHPALKNKYRGYNPATGAVNHNGNWYDAYAGRTTPYDDSQSPHGTHVMGTILGQEPSGKNAIGVAPGAKFIVAKGLGPNGGSANQLISAGQWMLKPGGNAANAPDIINNSWGGGTGINDWFRGVVRAWRAAGIVPVFAAGNQLRGEPAPWPGSITLPSSYPESFAVAATDSSNRRGSFSKLGPSPYDNNIPKPDISAPGVNIRSSVINGYESGWNGTSMAAPNIAGVAALILEANPNLSVVQVENAIKNTATPLTDTTYRTSPNMGYGYGLVDALRAIQSVSGSRLSQPIETSTLTGRIIDNNTGEAISGASITIDNTSLNTTTDSNGYYTINNIPVGSYTVTVTATGYNPISDNITINANQEITANGTMVLNTATIQTGTIAGRVTDYNTGVAVSGARVDIDGTTLYAYTDDYGYFILNNVQEGVQTISISGHEHNTVSGNVTVTPGKTINVTARLIPSSDYKSTLEDEITEPILEPIIESPIIEVPITESPTVDM